MHMIRDAAEREGLAAERDTSGLDCAIEAGLDRRADQGQAIPR